MDEAVLIIDKSVGPSSFDVVRKVRNFVKIKKVGHAGTLDPFATGVLVLLTGRATKLSNALINADKRYQAVIKLGESTDSMDCTGKVVETLAVPTLTQAQVEAVLKSFQGEWHQIPPMFSAKKVQGVRLYELARKNISIPRESIPVQLYELKLLSLDNQFLKFEVHCSKGTYIRSLADEIARKLETVGHLVELRRLSCGGFSLDDSFTVEQLINEQTDWKTQGYRNYVKLLSSESAVQTHKPTKPREMEYSRSFERAELSGGGQGINRFQSSHLPRQINNDMSILN